MDRAPLPRPHQTESVVPMEVEASRLVKIRLPLELHLKLHALKITGKRSISTIVTNALQAYLERWDEDPARSDLVGGPPACYWVEHKPFNARPPGPRAGCANSFEADEAHPEALCRLRAWSCPSS